MNVAEQKCIDWRLPEYDCNPCVEILQFVCHLYLHSFRIATLRWVYTSLFSFSLLFKTSTCFECYAFLARMKEACGVKWNMLMPQHIWYMPLRQWVILVFSFGICVLFLYATDIGRVRAYSLFTHINHVCLSTTMQQRDVSQCQTHYNNPYDVYGEFTPRSVTKRNYNSVL